MNEKTVEKYIIVFILVVILFQVIASLFPTVIDASGNLTASGFPLASLFASTGVLWIIVSAGLLIMLYRSFSGTTRK